MAHGVKRDKNGLTRCISALDKLSAFFEEKCSLKSKELRLRKSEETMVTIKAVSKYRKRMLRVLTNSDEAQNSALTKTFVDNFKAVAVIGTADVDNAGNSNEDTCTEEQALYTHVTTHSKTISNGLG